VQKYNFEFKEYKITSFLIIAFTVTSFYNLLQVDMTNHVRFMIL